MKIGSWNIRGLGGQIKKDEIHSFLTNNKLDFCCVQDTKLVDFYEIDGQRLWKSDFTGVLRDRWEGREGFFLFGTIAS